MLEGTCMLGTRNYPLFKKMGRVRWVAKCNGNIQWYSEVAYWIGGDQRSRWISQMFAWWRVGDKHQGH